MLDLQNETLQAWKAKLPEDVRAAIADELPADSDEISGFVTALNNAEIAEYAELIEAHPEVVKALGRLGRIRLLSFIVAKVYPFQVRVFHELLNAERDDEEGGGRSATQVLFIEDIKAFNEAIAARVYGQHMDGPALTALQEAAYETQALPGLG